jgi:hypothetical protein
MIINPLTAFKNSLLKEIEVFGKKFTFDPSIKIKSTNKIDLLANGLKAVDGFNLKDFSNIKEEIDKGINEEEAIKKEIDSWDSKITDILFNKFISLLQKYNEIDFDKLPDLRVYWKIRKIFSKEEIDSWSDCEWQWAVYNIYQDEIDQDKFDDRRLEKRKMWYNSDLYGHIIKAKEAKEAEKEEQKSLIKKLFEKQYPSASNVEFEVVDAEENDIPSIIEEGK